MSEASSRDAAESEGDLLKRLVDEAPDEILFSDWINQIAQAERLLANVKREVALRSGRSPKRPTETERIDTSPPPGMDNFGRRVEPTETPCQHDLGYEQGWEAP